MTPFEQLVFFFTPGGWGRSAPQFKFGSTLDSNIVGEGGNFSVGQRQIITLAGAMVRSSKPLILDEGQLFES